MAVDITWDLIRLLNQNGREAQQSHAGWLSTGSLDMDQMVWFAMQVGTGRPWDFKNNIFVGVHQVKVCGRFYTNDMPGNFHYGFVGAAARIKSEALYAGAGRVHSDPDTANPNTYGDDPIDHVMIRLGITLYEKVGLRVEYTRLSTVLDTFDAVYRAVVPQTVLKEVKVDAITNAFPRSVLKEVKVDAITDAFKDATLHLHRGRN